LVSSSKKKKKPPKKTTKGEQRLFRVKVDRPKKQGRGKKLEKICPMPKKRRGQGGGKKKNSNVRGKQEP